MREKVEGWKEYKIGERIKHERWNVVFFAKKKLTYCGASKKKKVT